MWVRSFETIEELRLALLAFKRTYTAIYGIEESEDTRALVLELVEGPTLADHIKQRPIPVDEALPIAKQTTEALEAAQEQGVIYRDLKSAHSVRHAATMCFAEPEPNSGALAEQPLHTRWLRQ